MKVKTFAIGLANFSGLSEAFDYVDKLSNDFFRPLMSLEITKIHDKVFHPANGEDKPGCLVRRITYKSDS